MTFSLKSIITSSFLFFFLISVFSLFWRKLNLVRHRHWPRFCVISPTLCWEHWKDTRNDSPTEVSTFHWQAQQLCRKEPLNLLSSKTAWTLESLNSNTLLCVWTEFHTGEAEEAEEAESSVRPSESVVTEKGNAVPFFSFCVGWKVLLWLPRFLHQTVLV